MTGETGLAFKKVIDTVMGYLGSKEGIELGEKALAFGNKAQDFARLTGGIPGLNLESLLMKAGTVLNAGGEVLEGKAREVVFQIGSGIISTKLAAVKQWATERVPFVGVLDIASGHGDPSQAITKKIADGVAEKLASFVPEHVTTPGAPMRTPVAPPDATPAHPGKAG